EEITLDGYYLPHRHVIKESSTTRIRPVFDASAAGNDGFSLNQCLETGPNLIELIPNILVRFRRHKIGVTADIRKAFLQISVSQEDRDVLRFLWWKKSCSEEVEVYRHRRVVFGVSSSPFLLGGTIEYHLERALQGAETEDERKVIQHLQKSYYVDNCVTSVDSEDELFLFKEESKRVMAKGKFDLRGWEHSGQKSITESTSVLGLNWNKEDDTLGLAPSLLKLQTTTSITKRAILSAAQRVFDPIGISSPAFLKPKLLLQELWSHKITWDMEVPANIKIEFNEWQQQLFWLEGLRIPRWAYRQNKETRDLSFHIFVDASQDAYAAALFARTEGPEDVYVQLVAAKSRVAPVEKATIPRLELLAATIGVRLWNSLKDSLDAGKIEVFFWSDSTTVLAWINRDKPWNTFVYNRVKEIRKLSDPNQWHHIPGTMNPADLPSRGCTAKHLVESRWWEGPKWLKSSKQQWPIGDHATNEEEINKEMKKSVNKKKIQSSDALSEERCMLALSQEEGWYMRRQSSYLKIVRTVGWILRFISNCRTSRDSRLVDELTAKEFTTAELTVLRLSQQESFNGISDARFKTLNVYEDENKLLRLKSPVINREDTYDFRCPIVLDPKHLLIKKLIDYKHKQLNHAGIQIVMGNLREMCWILNCRAAVRSAISNCVTCKRHKVNKLEATSGDLPNERVKDAKVFEVAGIDYVGPLYLKNSQKAWICLFTCAIYRAIHFELTTSLSTDAFLQALRRFIARRGRPAIIYTDNGTNFVGARNLLHKIDWDKIKRFSATQKIDWRLNPPAAPWWGGWWERLAIINSRPLGYLADDTTQLKPLTPMMFLQETIQNEVPDLDRVEVNLTKRIKYRQSLRDELRKRFRSEYLGQLSRRTKSNSFVIKEGDIVLLGHDNLKRLDWPLARVVKVLPGKDGVTRVVKLKTATGELVRPVQRLYPLEMLPSTMETVDYDMNAADQTKEEDQAATIDATQDVLKREFRTRSGRRVKAPDRLGF
ncbi:PREDICTED: uncharacterized protein LOC105457307, partial [Wasmannia auropunctata]|uniref:uncharacterized protein LOC105457307 n=1 Tax=Wasmannia auropunctata TaxID=64793 RepID=UPI0005EDEBC6